MIDTWSLGMTVRRDREKEINIKLTIEDINDIISCLEAVECEWGSDYSFLI